LVDKNLKLSDVYHLDMHYSDWQELFGLSWRDFWPVLQETSRLRETRFGQQVSLCVIINAKSGLCSEDCAFCSQSVRAQTEIPTYPLLPREKLVEAAQAAAEAGAARFSLVTSGRGMALRREQEAILASVAAIREAVDIKVCASLGIVDRGFLAELKAAGVERFHHNLEAAVIVQLNRVIRGTANYFATPWSHCGDLYRSLDRWIRRRLRCMKYKRKSEEDNFRLRLKHFRHMGLLSLSNLRSLA